MEYDISNGCGQHKARTHFGMKWKFSYIERCGKGWAGMGGWPILNHCRWGDEQRSESTEHNKQKKRLAIGSGTKLGLRLSQVHTVAGSADLQRLTRPTASGVECTSGDRRDDFICTKAQIDANVRGKDASGNSTDN